MPKTKLEEWDEVAANNTDLDNIPTSPNNMYPTHARQFAQEIMSQVASWIGDDTLSSATTTDLGSVPGRYVSITGTTTITGLGTIKAGTIKFVTFSGILTLTHNGTNLILPGAANITTAAGDTAAFVSQGSGNWRCIAYQRASGRALTADVPTPPRGAIYGLTLSNNASDATNDIDIAAGTASSDATTPVSMALAASLTKRLDAAWAVGSGNGGLDTGTIANTTYHVWLIQRSDTGVVDALFSTSATSPTMPANYDRKRRIGSIIRSSGAILPFTQKSDEFLLKTALLDVDATSAPGTTAVLYALTVPAGLEVGALIEFAGYSSNGSTPTLLLTSPAQTDIAVSDGGGSPFSLVSLSNQWSANSAQVRTNTSSQIRARASVTFTRFKITTFGWIDTRGKD